MTTLCPSPSLSLPLSRYLYHAHTSAITLSSRLVSNNAFIHSNAPSVGYQTYQFSSTRGACSEIFHRLHIIQPVPFSSFVLNYSPTRKYSFPSNQPFYRVSSLEQDPRESRQLNLPFVRCIFRRISRCISRSHRRVARSSTEYGPTRVKLRG